MNFTLLPTNTARQGHTATLAEIAAAIGEGQIAPLMEPYRTNPTKEVLKAVKAKTPAFVTSGELVPGSRTVFASYNACVQLDYDGLSEDAVALVKEAVSQHPSTVLAFASMSGNGVKVLVKTTNTNPTPDHHRAAWQHTVTAFAAYLMEYTEGWCPTADPATKDAVRLCYLSVDATCYCNPAAEALPVPAYTPLAAVPLVQEYVPIECDTTTARALDAVAYLASHCPGMVASYPDYLRFVFACLRAFGQHSYEGKEAARAVCMASEGYNATNFERKWADKGVNGNGPGVAWIFRRALDAGWQYKPAAVPLAMPEYDALVARIQQIPGTSKPREIMLAQVAHCHRLLAETRVCTPALIASFQKLLNGKKFIPRGHRYSLSALIDQYLKAADTYLDTTTTKP